MLFSDINSLYVIRFYRIFFDNQRRTILNRNTVGGE
ncbi:hypothetical protein Hbor_14190 [Halogeometricum borinquense DSM 11551]|uniref:Uncharacterized protein n=1 Tax=Halogeometricum borinquense (strain ATCC 700274 / DSM 11551 / JCM 10706 / KCTC 4070 / PR3) TaxID=469382 RepID=E4NT06_HALBP|nr:hypothetical protein Hbor_14190 [Halogeometricum borinquense DSM 11551]